MFLNNTVRYVLITVVTTAWVVNLGAPFFVGTYNPDPSVNAVFMFVIGALFGPDAVGRIKGNGNGNGHGNGTNKTRPAQPESKREPGDD